MRAAKAALALALLVAVSFACTDPLMCAYTDPPMDIVMAHNFNSNFLYGLADNPEENFSIFSATLIGMFPSVEDRIPADADTYQILWTWGENIAYINDTQYAVVTTENGTYIIDSQQTQYYFTIKVDNELVVEYMNESPSSITNFTFSRTQEQMEKYNATERMEVRLDYSVDYYEEGYIVVHDGGDSELYYYVENGNVTFFTVRPVLGEQWYRNNHFDNLVFSKKRFYKGEVYLDGALTGSVHTLNFSIYNDTFGTWFINSSQDYNNTNVTMGEHEMVYSPTPLIHNNESFRYLYEENFSYAGIGRHNLTLVLTDDFNHTLNYSRELLSRAAGEQEAAEEGAYYARGGTEYARPTYEKPEESLTQVIIPTGALAIIFIVVAASTWWGMTGAKRI